MTEEKDYEALEREYIGVQQMLAFVLKAIGHPVTVSTKLIDRGLNNEQIAIEQNLEDGYFVFSVEEISE